MGRRPLPRLPGQSHADYVRALDRAGYRRPDRHGGSCARCGRLLVLGWRYERGLGYVHPVCPAPPWRHDWPALAAELRGIFADGWADLRGVWRADTEDQTHSGGPA